MEYAKGIFDAWYEGIEEARMCEELGICVNHGYSSEVCMPKARKVK